MTVMQGNMRWGGDSRRKRVTLSAFVACLFGVSALPISAVGAESVDRTTAQALLSAFTEALGTDGEQRPLPYRLEVTRYGGHWLLSGMNAAGETARSLECLLCTELEAVDAAGRLGAGLGRRHRGEPEAPLPTVSTRVSTVAPEAELRSRVPTARPTVRLRWAAVSAIFGGGALAAGGVMLWLDETCADAQCGHKHYLTGAGIGLLVGGAVLETTALLLWRLKRKPRDAR